ncbi:phosphonate ABC transporter, permease protein PhnE [Pannonibacter sp. SL95]|uniref:phosphonate ABC transporter, permease protein PhnE n=1 Tax=Pannonibacter sp. SL95 TaxID=2995153 RepID=UPI00227697B8|nr:phosphonate ABC transporter, permease protein PhnE [Pannonibacter sp. SL95]MCY1708891.1 phosphonate ABC transporter, permease protein PhnE [Pannonibacter sp. SL95]
MSAQVTLTQNPRLREIGDAYERLSRSRSLYTVLLIVVCAVIIIGGFMVADEANSGSFWGGLSSFFDYPADIITGTYAAGWGWFALVWSYLPFLVETINIAVLSTIIGFALGALLSFVASRNLVRNKLIVFCMRRVMDICRAFPELVIALVLVLSLGPTPLAAVIAVAFHTIGALAKLFSEVNENADMKPVDGLKSVGATWGQQMRFGVLPQVLPNFLSYGLLRLEINVRASAILGFVGAGGLGAELKKVVDWNYAADISAIIVLLVAAVIGIDYLSGWARRALIGKTGTI